MASENLDKLLAMLDGVGRMPAVQKEPQVSIVDTPLELKPEILADENNYLDSKPALYLKSVAEPALQSQLKDWESAADNTKALAEKKAASADELRTAAEELSKANPKKIIPDEFTDMLLRNLLPDDAKKAAQAKEKGDREFNELLVTAFLPPLLGSKLGFGAAGAAPAAKVQETAIDAYRKRQARDTEIQAKRDNQSELLKTVLGDQRGVEKQNFEKAKQLSEVAKYLYGELSTEYKAAKANEDKLAQALTSNTLNTGNDIAQLQRAEDGVEALAQSRIEQEKGRTARANQKQMQPSEGERKSAEAYAGMTKAEQAFERLRKDHPIVPSRTKQFFDIQKQAFENSDGNTLMGEVIKKIPDGPVRRQIQIELDFLAKKLRRESGAAISVSEYVAEGNINFPRFGDDAKTLAEKDASRKQTLDGMKLSAGRAPIAPIVQPKYPATQKKTAPVDLKKMSIEEKKKKLKELRGE